MNNDCVGYHNLKKLALKIKYHKKPVIAQIENIKFDNRTIYCNIKAKNTKLILLNEDFLLYVFVRLRTYNQQIYA